MPLVCQARALLSLVGEAVVAKTAPLSLWTAAISTAFAVKESSPVVCRSKYGAFSKQSDDALGRTQSALAACKRQNLPPRLSGIATEHPDLSFKSELETIKQRRPERV